MADNGGKLEIVMVLAHPLSATFWSISVGQNVDEMLNSQLSGFASLDYHRWEQHVISRITCFNIFDKNEYYRYMQVNFGHKRLTR